MTDKQTEGREANGATPAGTTLKLFGITAALKRLENHLIKSKIV